MGRDLQREGHTCNVNISDILEQRAAHLGELPAGSATAREEPGIAGQCDLLARCTGPGGRTLRQCLHQVD